jgi:hypothetical protein
MYVAPNPSVNPWIGNEGPIRVRRYCLTCEDHNHFNRDNDPADSYPQDTFDSVFFKKVADPQLMANISTFLTDVDEEGERLGVFGPPAPLEEWEANGDWVGLKKEWTTESIQEHLAATADHDMDDPETWVRQDAPLRLPEMSVQVAPHYPQRRQRFAPARALHHTARRERRALTPPPQEFLRCPITAWEKWDRSAAIARTAMRAHAPCRMPPPAPARLPHRTSPQPAPASPRSRPTRRPA